MRRHVNSSRTSTDLFVRAKSVGALCDSCPLRSTGHPVFGTGPTEFDFAIIGEGPGRSEIEHGIPFYGRSGELLDEWLSSVGIARSTIYIDNAMLCMPPGGDYGKFERGAKHDAKVNGHPYNSPISCCNERLLRALHIPTCAKCGKRQVGVDRCKCDADNDGHVGALSDEARARAKTKWVKQATRIGSGKHTKMAVHEPPRVVIAMGNPALAALTGLTGITKWRGSAMEF